MGCAVPEQVFNLVFLAPLVAVALYNSWSSLKSFSFSADVSSIATTAGAVSSAVALCGFSALLAADCCMCGPNECILGILCSIASIVDVLCYAAWSWYGTVGNFCSGVSHLSGAVREAAGSAVDCDKRWMTFLMWAWLGISGSLQLSIAFSALNFGGNSNANSLRKATSRSISKKPRARPRPRRISNQSEPDSDSASSHERWSSTSSSDSDSEGSVEERRS
ncbi:hypothetical protein JCM16303_006919 [Sporobolomyces ruberrimus]